MERRGYQGRKGMCVMRTDWDVTMRCDAMRCVVMRCAVGIGGKAISPAQSNELSCEWECTRQYGQSGRGVERSHAVSNTPAPASSPASLLLRSCSCSLAPFQLLPLPPVSKTTKPSQHLINDDRPPHLTFHSLRRSIAHHSLIALRYFSPLHLASPPIYLLHLTETA
jgi:hypothetical protein